MINVESCLLLFYGKSKINIRSYNVHDIYDYFANVFHGNVTQSMQGNET